MKRPAVRASSIVSRSFPAARRERSALAVAAALALGVACADRAAADVTRSGDVSPPFAPAPVVDLTGQPVFIGNTTGGVGAVGTVNVTGGGILTAAQIVPGTGGLGTGFVNVIGAGSTIRLTGGSTFNGLDIGSWGTGVVNVSGGGLIACSSVAACPFNAIGNAAGSTGTLAINGGSVTGLGVLTVGQGALSPGFGTTGATTTGTLSITNGGTLSTAGANAVANNTGQTGRVTGNVTLDGAGSTWTISRDLASGGSQAGVTVGRASNSAGTMTISNGARLNIVGARATPATDNSLPSLQIGVNGTATGSVFVTSGGSVRFSGDTGFLNVGGNSVSTGGTGTLDINSGGTIAGTGPNGLVFVGVGRLGGASGTINIDGAGSQLAVAGVGGQNSQGLDGVGGIVLIGGTGGLSGALNIRNGGSLSIADNGSAAPNGGPGLRLADGTSSANVVVSGAGSSVTVSSTSAGTATLPYVIVGNGGNAHMTISDGATVSILANGERNFTVQNRATGSGVLDMTNGAQVLASRFAVGDNGGTGIATIDHSTINLDGVIIFQGVETGAGLRVGRGVGANGTLTLQNGSVVNINNTVDSANVILGGTTALAGGTGTLNMAGGSAINFTGSAANASLQVGGIEGTGFMTMAGGSTVNVGLTGGALVGNTAGSNGTLSVGGGSSITANFFGVGGNSDTVAGGNGTAVVSGAGSALHAVGATGFIGVGRGGIGSLLVSDAAALSATVVSVGRGSGFGSLTVDGAAINLSGQQTAGLLSGAAFTIGSLGGTGNATIRNGSVVTIANDGSAGANLNIGGAALLPGGNGALVVTDSRITLTAAPGQATARIGHDGNGVATLANSTLTVGNRTESGADGVVVVAGQPGSTGFLALNAGSVVNAGYVGVGATPTGQGGTGVLILNDSTINTTTFEIGALGVLAGDGGTINASGDVIVGGTISPGNSPGRVTIDCNLIMLPGSMLVLDVLGTGDGFEVDHLRIGDNSTFDLHDLHIVFNFIGDTDPNSFAKSGGFDLDNFIQSLDLQTGAVSGLSTAFAPGQTWEDVVDPDAFTAVSPVYDISNIQIHPDGTVTAVAVPVPEPETWAMLVVGLMTLGAMARRRQRRC